MRWLIETFGHKNLIKLKNVTHQPSKDEKSSDITLFTESSVRRVFLFFVTILKWGESKDLFKSILKMRLVCKTKHRTDFCNGFITIG